MRHLPSLLLLLLSAVLLSLSAGCERRPAEPSTPSAGPLSPSSQRVDIPPTARPGGAGVVLAPVTRIGYVHEYDGKDYVIDAPGDVARLADAIERDLADKPARPPGQGIGASPPMALVIYRGHAAEPTEAHSLLVWHDDESLRDRDAAFLDPSGPFAFPAKRTSQVLRELASQGRLREVTDEARAGGDRAAD